MYWRNISTFGESYYDHACSIDYEKDILDIIYNNNNNCWTRVKRWWHDLFLLSYYDPRSKYYYRSSHSMRMERLKQYHYNKTMIHPFSKFRSFWDCLILSTVLLNILVLNHATSVIYGDLSWEFYFIGVICEVILITDLFINMITGWENIDDRMINLELKKSVVNYCSTKLFLHFISSLPLQAIMFLKYGKSINCAICKCNRFVFTLRLMNALRLYRLYDASGYWKRERSSFHAMTFFKFLRIAVLGVVTMVIFINMVDTIYLLAGMCSGIVDPETYSITVIRFKYDESTRRNSTYFLILEYSRVFKAFLLFSFTLKPLKHYWDKITCVLSYVLANIFYMWNFMECYGCLSLMKYSEEKIVINNYRIKNLLRWRQLSDKFSLKVMQYCRFNMTELAITEKQNGCYEALPQSLLREITISSYAKYVSRIPYFSEWPQTLIEQITLLLVEEVYMANDIVVEASLSSEGLIIVDVGVLSVYYPSDVGVTYLIDGDYFGEISLVAKENFVTPSVVALTSTKLFFLDKTAFRRLMREYPKLFFAMYEEIKKINLLNPHE